MSKKREKPPVAVAVPGPTTAQKELLFEAEVRERCRMSRAQLFKLINAGLFPPRKKYGFRRAGWPTREIEEWIAIGADAWAERRSPRRAA
jgi:predicted DNA-binding transcriptional regulator AlpA